MGSAAEKSLRMVSDVSGVHAHKIDEGFALLKWLLVVFALLTGFAFLFGGGLSEGGRWRRLSDALYLALQMMFANGDPEQTAHPCMQVLRLFAPAVLPLFGVLAFVSALKSRLRFLVAHWRNRVGAPGALVRPLDAFARQELIVIVGLGTKGLERAREKLARYAVAAIEKDPEAKGIAEIAALGALVWVGDAMSDADLRVVFWKRPREIWVMTGDSRDNLIIMDKIADFLGHGSDKPHVDLYANVASFLDRLDAMWMYPLNRDSASVWTHLFNQEEELAQWLLHKHPVCDLKGRTPRVLVIGLGAIGRAIVRESLLMCHFPKVTPAGGQDAAEALPGHDTTHSVLEIVAVDAHGSSNLALTAELPFLERPIPGVSPFADISFIESDVRRWDFNHYRDTVRGGSPFARVFIAMGSEARNIAMAERLWTWERLIGEGMPQSIVPIIYSDSAEKWLALEEPQNNGQIAPLSINAVFGEAAAEWSRSLREMAFRIHQVYTFRSNSSEPLDQEASADREADVERRWTQLSEHDRRSDLAQARYIAHRWGSPSDSVSRGLVCSPEALDAEAECEHRRWNAFQLVENVGFIDSAYPSDESLRIRGDSGSEKAVKVRKLARVHKDLIPFAELQSRDAESSQKTADIDRVFVWNRDFILGATSSCQMPPGVG